MAERGGDRGGFGRGFGGRGRGGDRGRGRRRAGRRDEEEKWVPVTKLGRLVKEGKIQSLEQIYLHSLPIKEHQIVDTLIGPSLKDEVMKIMPVQKQTRAGQRTRFKAFVVVGDGNGHVGLGVKCSKEGASEVPSASAAPLSPAASATTDPVLLLEALDDDLEDFTPSASIPESIQLESTSVSVPEALTSTSIITSSSAQLKSTKKTQKKKKLNYDPNKARNERRFELACLRKEVKDLEMTLEQLQSMQGKECSTTVKRPRAHALPRPVSAGSGMSAVWEQICVHQLERRLRVERENIHLKMMYKSQAQVARSIERLLQKRLALQDTTYSEISKHTSRIEVPQGYTTDVDQKIFEDLSTGVEVSYKEVDAVFEAHDPARTHLPTREPVMRDSINGRYMELFDNKIMPFDMRSTGDAWWRRWHNYKGHCAHENGPNNTIVEKFGLEMKDVKTRMTATFYVQQILKRHVEEGRIVIVWHAHIKPLEFEKKPANGVHYLEKGYVLIKPHIADPGSNEAATRVMTCYIISPQLADRKLRTDAKTTALTDFVLSATSANISMSNEMIENLLVDRALQRQKQARG